MFIVSLTYKKPIEEIENLISDHNAFLQKYYDIGKFITSGRKEPRSGGIILANASSRSEIENIAKEDPFYIHQAATYDITEFIPTKYDENFKIFIKNQ